MSYALHLALNQHRERDKQNPISPSLRAVFKPPPMALCIDTRFASFEPCASAPTQKTKHTIMAPLRVLVAFAVAVALLAQIANAVSPPDAKEVQKLVADLQVIWEEFERQAPVAAANADRVKSRIDGWLNAYPSHIVWAYDASRSKDSVYWRPARDEVVAWSNDVAKLQSYLKDSIKNKDAIGPFVYYLIERVKKVIA